MKKYEIEHIGISVEHPIEMANWYRDVLGFNIKFVLGTAQQALSPG